MPLPVIQPRLVVDDAAAAIAFYVSALGAIEVMRFADPSVVLGSFATIDWAEPAR